MLAMPDDVLAGNLLLLLGFMFAMGGSSLCGGGYEGSLPLKRL